MLGSNFGLSSLLSLALGGLAFQGGALQPEVKTLSAVPDAHMRQRTGRTGKNGTHKQVRRRLLKAGRRRRH